MLVAYNNSLSCFIVKYLYTLSVLPFGAHIVAQGIVPVNVGREKTGNISTESNR